MRNERVISRIISAIFGDKVAVRENLFYDTVKGALDFADDDLINKRAAAALSGVEYQTFAVAGDPNPLNIPVATLVANGINKLEPAVRNTIPLYGHANSDTTEGTVSRVDYNYTDPTKTVLVSIDVWGNDNGSGGFNEDTNFTIS